ncbi:MAG: beta-lactamase family protein [Acidimicrobiia bacterium]|nr:beta-lactamase family protein [Acidimicrobiia bacterium]MYJ31173.1 beta-lactamase family protein [Acidimicrobiia bacterium]
MGRGSDLGDGLGMRGGGSTGKVLRAAVTGIALALWSVACSGSNPVTVPEGSGETTEAVEPSELVDDEPTQEAQIRGLLEEFVEDGQSVGVVVGIVREGERVVVGAGRLSDGDPVLPDGDTVFEIGSITKVFTSTALADLEASLGLGLETPVQSLLGDQVQMPTRNGTEITLGHLATHSSGLPRLPNNLAPVDWANPYADYTAERLYDFLADHELARNIGETVEYSNLGYGLLGHALSLSEGTNYETVIVQRILEPLEMADTAVNLTPPLQARMAAGHDQRLQPVANWDLAVLAGAGALRSTVNDLVTFLEANLGLRQTPLREAMQRTHVPQVTDPAMGMDLGLGWLIADIDGRRFLWHNGATGGYSSFIGFDPEAREGIVILSNSVISVDSLAQRLVTRYFEG